MKGKNGDSTPFLPLKSKTGGKSNIRAKQRKFVFDRQRDRLSMSIKPWKKVA